MDLPTFDPDVFEDHTLDLDGESTFEDQNEDEPIPSEVYEAAPVSEGKSVRRSHGGIPKTHQLKAINVLLKTVLGYDEITISSTAKTIISHAGVHFAKDILVKSSKIDNVKHRKRIGLEDIRANIICTIPAPDLMVRMQRAISDAVESHKQSVASHVNLHGRGRPKPVHGEERAGLHVKMSNVRNLARISVPNFAGIDTLAYVAVAACMEVMLKEIIHRCVGALVSAATAVSEDSSARPGMTEPVIRSQSSIRFRIEDHDVYLVLNRKVRIENIQRMASRHPLFRSKKRNVEEEVEHALEGKTAGKRKIIRETKRSVEKWNKEEILRGDEILFLMGQANAIPMIFSNFKVPGARTMPNVRVDMLPEKLQKRCVTDIQASISRSSLDGAMTLRVLDYLVHQYIRTKDGRRWATR